MSDELEGHVYEGARRVFVEEVPGANTQGETLEEARANLEEAVAMVLEAEPGDEGRLNGREVRAMGELIFEVTQEADGGYCAEC